MSTESAQIEAGHVFLPRSAAWLGDFQAELLQFPHGQHDDQVDSMSQFLAWVRKRSAEVFLDAIGLIRDPRSKNCLVSRFRQVVCQSPRPH